jgi:hypothetical protein
VAVAGYLSQAPFSYQRQQSATSNFLLDAHVHNVNIHAQLIRWCGSQQFPEGKGKTST